jgi:hypothetical protein
MGIRVVCPNGHKLNVKSFLAGKRGVCPHCGAKFDIPAAKDHAAKSDSSDEKVQSVGKVSTASGAATATSTSSAELRASHLAKAAGTARRDMPAAPAAVPVAPVTPVGQGVAPVAPVKPVAGAPVAAVQASPVQAATGGMAPVSAVPLGAAQPVSAQPVAAQPLGLPGMSPLGLGPTAGVPAAIVRPAVPDPLAEAPEASWYVRPPSGGQYGPAKPHTIREWMAQGRITADSLVWREGWPDWKLAGATFPSLGAGAPGGAPSAPAPGAAAADDPFAVLGPANPSASLSTSTLTSSRRTVGARRGDGTGRVMAITVLCLALVVLSALLVYVLNLR